jgi:hypothetical protein
VDPAGIGAARLGPIGPEGGRRLTQYAGTGLIIRYACWNCSIVRGHIFTRRTVMRNRIAAVLLALPLLLVAATAYAGDGCCADKACCERCTDC